MAMKHKTSNAQLNVPAAVCRLAEGGPNLVSSMKKALSFTLNTALLGSGLLMVPASAQILVSAGSPYTQNFDSLASSGTPGWSDNTTLPGWYASQSIGGPSVATYHTGTGSSTAGALYSFGVAGVNPVTDRALGSVASGTPGNFAYGVRFQNDTAQAITNITISYTGEQWRNGGNTATQNLAFAYFISNNPITSSDAAGANAWISFNALNFSSPIVGATAAALDGNAAANRQVFPATLLSGVVVYPGQEIFFRWFDVNDAGNDHGLAVDDLTISFTSFTAIINQPNIAPNGQPQSVTNNAGTRASFTVNATGGDLTYQWLLNGTALNDSARILGSGLASVSISNVAASDAGSYTVIVTNSSGAITSAPAVLTVIDPAVNTQPLSRTNIAGDTANFFISAGGTPLLSYQWRFNGEDIVDATRVSLNVLNVQATNQGSYDVVVGNGLGNYATSSVATLTLLASPANELARWDFNATNVLVAASPAPSVGSGTASLLNGVTATFSSGTYSDPAGAPGAANSGWNTATYPPQGTSNKTAGVQFNVSTLGYQDILLAFEERDSDTASKYFRLQYTTDGSTFVDGNVLTMLDTNNSFVFYTSDLSGIPGVDNNPNFGFRIVSEWEATAIGNTNSNYVAAVTAYVPTGTSSGTMRYDLVSVFGNTLSSATLAPTTISNIIGTTLTYGGGAGSQFVLLKSANPASPLGGWSRVHTNFATPGTFSVPTGSEAVGFYRIKSE